MLVTDVVTLHRLPVREYSALTLLCWTKERFCLGQLSFKTFFEVYPSHMILEVTVRIFGDTLKPTNWTDTVARCFSEAAVNSLTHGSNTWACLGSLVSDHSSVALVTFSFQSSLRFLVLRLAGSREG